MYFLQTLLHLEVLLRENLRTHSCRHRVGDLCWPYEKIEFDLLATTEFVVCDFSLDQTTIEKEIMTQFQKIITLSLTFVPLFPKNQAFCCTVCVIWHVLLK